MKAVGFNSFQKAFNYGFQDGRSPEILMEFVMYLSQTDGVNEIEAVVNGECSARLSPNNTEIFRESTFEPQTRLSPNIGHQAYFKAPATSHSIRNHPQPLRGRALARGNVLSFSILRFRQLDGKFSIAFFIDPLNKFFNRQIYICSNTIVDFQHSTILSFYTRNHHFTNYLF